MEEKLAEWITDLSIYMMALPIMIGLARLKSLHKEQKAILVLVVLAAFVEVLSDTMRYQHQKDYQYVVFYGYTVIEYLILSSLFSRYVKALFHTSFLVVANILFFLTVCLDIGWWSGINQFNGYSTAIESLLVIFFVVSYFLKTLQEMQTKHLEREPLFWISTGLLLYFASSLFIFLFTNYVVTSDRILFIIWGIHGIFNALLHVFYCIALWMKPNP